MKKSLLVALSVAGLVLGATTSFAEDKEVTLEGEAQCNKCSLKKAEKCEDVVVVKKDGKEEVYHVAKSDATKGLHKEICTEKKTMKFTGTVKEANGKKELHAKKYEIVKK